MRPTRAAAAVLMLLVAACGSSSSRPAPSGPAPSGPAPAASASPTPALTTLDPGLPANTGDDPGRALRAIVRYRHRLLRAPQPDLVALIYAPACTCADALRQQVQRFVRHGLRLEGGPPRVSNVRVLERTGALATVRYTVRSAAGLIRDGAGRVVERGGASAARRFESQLLRTDGRWLVQTIREVDG